MSNQSIVSVRSGFVSKLVSSLSVFALLFWLVAPGIGPINSAKAAVAPVTTTIFANKDSFIRGGADNTNEGINPGLRIKGGGDNRLLVGFDLSGIDSSQVTSATLVMTAFSHSGSGPDFSTQSWDKKGTEGLTAHRLLSDWTEGNGRDGDVANTFQVRGTGSGVTWNCSTDSNIVNGNDDCPSQWYGADGKASKSIPPSYAPSTASKVTILNGFTGDVSFDVTADVLAGATNGWLIQKMPKGSGNIHFYSKEGPAFYGADSSLAPRLVITYIPPAPTTGSLTVIKNTVGGDGTFNFTGDAGDFSIETSDNTGAKTIDNLTPGTYNISENAFGGWDLTNNGCTEVNVVAGKTAECTITNTKHGSITVHKDVVAPDGETQVSDNHEFAVTLNGDNQNIISEETSYTYTDLSAGDYTIAENADPNYSLVGITGDGSVAVNPGANTDVTVTNKQKQGSLTVKKIVTNPNGGTAVAGDFSFKVNGGDPISFTQDELDASLGENDLTVDPGTYTISEVTPEGSYAISYNNCEDINVASNGEQGGSSTCTITNSDIPAGLGAVTVRKVVVNDNGGEAVSSDFSLMITPEEGDPILVDNGEAIFLEPGTYTVSEGKGPSGYTQSSLVCTGGEESESGTFTLEAQEAYTCTITNDDIAPSLTLVKEVTNDNGGQATSEDWTLSATRGESETPSLSGAGGAESDLEFQAGNYTLNEDPSNIESTVTEGYSASDWSCIGDVSNDGNSINLDIGQEATCTIINNDQPSTLTIIKNTDEASGDGLFHFAVNGTDETDYSNSFSMTTSGGNAVSEEISLDRGSYDVTESVEAGWHLAGVECTYDDQSVGESIQAGGEHISVGNGDDVTCTFTNTKQGTLKIKKVVINDNDGTKTAEDFSFKIDDGDSIAFNQQENSLLGENDVVVNPGTYNVAENSAEGYNTTYDNCSNVEVPAAGEATCTITNNDIAPSQEGGGDDTSDDGPGISNPGTGGGGGGGAVIIPDGGFIFPGQNNGVGQVLGASTGQPGTLTDEQALLAQAGCTEYISSYMRFGMKNNIDQVKKLQTFLKTNLGISLPVTGFFGPLTLKAVKALQLKYKTTVLDPWVAKGFTNLKDNPTGFVYLSTRWTINSLSCPNLQETMPELVPYSSN